MFIPHAATPMVEEMVTKKDIKYFALGGKYDKEYYIKKGIPKENIETTGIPRYEYIFQGEVKKLKEVKDMFEGEIYNFDKKN